LSCSRNGCGVAQSRAVADIYGIGIGGVGRRGGAAAVFFSGDCFATLFFPPFPFARQLIWREMIATREPVRKAVSGYGKQGPFISMDHDVVRLRAVATRVVHILSIA
jgi:hypothetical protein